MPESNESNESTETETSYYTTTYAAPAYKEPEYTTAAPAYKEPEYTTAAYVALRCCSRLRSSRLPNSRLS